MRVDVFETKWPHAWGPALRAGARPNLSYVLPDLLVGEYPLPSDAAWLRAEHAVRLVLSLQDDADLASKGLSLPELEYAYRANDIEFLRVPITDGDTEMLALRLEELVARIAAGVGSGRVYLHCNAGMNRAPTVAIAYVGRSQGLRLSEARDLVRARRFCVPYMSVLQEHFGDETQD